MLERHEALPPDEAAQYVSLKTEKPFTTAQLWELVLINALSVSLRCPHGAMGLRGQILPEAESSEEPSRPVFPTDSAYPFPSGSATAREHDRWAISEVEIFGPETYVRSFEDGTVLQLDPQRLERLGGVFDLCFAGDIENVILNADSHGVDGPPKKWQKLKESWGLYVKQEDPKTAWQLMEVAHDGQTYVPAVGLPHGFELLFRRSHLLQHIEDAKQDVTLGDGKFRLETALTMLGAVLSLRYSSEELEKTLKKEMEDLELRGLSEKSIADYFPRAKKAFKSAPPRPRK